jgi:hypothetical protein
MVDLKRRFFIFGAAATTAALVVPVPKSFFIIKPPRLIIPTPDRPFDLPTREMLSLLNRLTGKAIRMSEIPRWVVTDQTWYDDMVRNELREPHPTV